MSADTDGRAGVDDSIHELGSAGGNTIFPGRRDKLVADSWCPDHGFGSSAAFSSRTAVIGASGARVAHVFVQDGAGELVEKAVLEPTQAAPGFGATTAVWGDVIMVGAPGDGVGAYAGAVHVFVRVREGHGDVPEGEPMPEEPPPRWVFETVLVPSDSASGDSFGAAIAIAGDTAVIGAPGRGTAYVFTRWGGQWAEQARLEAPAQAAGGRFGASVAVWRNLAVIGAPAASGVAPGSGAAVVFTRRTGRWTEQAVLTAADAQSGDEFGGVVTAGGDTVLVSARNRDGGAGAVHVFDREGSGWAEAARIEPQDAATTAFGRTLALSGDLAVVGAQHPGRSGGVYLYQRDESGWRKLGAAMGNPGDGFGAAVALSNVALLVTAPFDNQSGAAAGAAYAFRVALAANLTCGAADTLGSLAECIADQMPDKDSEGFAIPVTTTQTDWRVVVREMLDGTCSETLPSSLATPMRRFVFEDAENGRPYCVLMEVSDNDGNGVVDRGWGTFVVDPNAVRELSHQAPHPLHDSTTEIQAIDIFKHTQSRSYLMCGAHRFANSDASTCQSSYDEADCAHSTRNMYFPTTLEIADFYGAAPHTQIQWHGMALSTCPGVDVYMTPGRSSAPPSGSNVLALQSNVEAYNPTWDVDVSGDGTCDLHGSSNVEGRHLNGVDPSKVCNTSAKSVTGEFVHIEQVKEFRVASAWTDAVMDTWPE